MKITGWGMFWLFMIFYLLVDTMLYYKGHNTVLWAHKTKAELEHQKKQLEE